MRIKRCEVVNCTDKSSTRHRFPVRNEDAFRIWLERMGNCRLKDYEKGQLYDRYICSSHFIEQCLHGKHLVRNSLPTINMPGFMEEPSMRNSFLGALHLVDRETIPHSRSLGPTVAEICQYPVQYYSTYVVD